MLIFVYTLYNHNWRNISTICIYNKTSIKRNILTIKQNTYREVGRAKDLSAPLYVYIYIYVCVCVCVCTHINSTKIYIYIYRGADKSLAQPGRKQSTATEDFDVHISYL